MTVFLAKCFWYTAIKKGKGERSRVLKNTSLHDFNILKIYKKKVLFGEKIVALVSPDLKKFKYCVNYVSLQAEFLLQSNQRKKIVVLSYFRQIFR